MKAVTLHVDEEVYSQFQKLARHKNTPAARLIREAMEQYYRNQTVNKSSLADAPPPASVGTITQAWNGRSDLLDSIWERH